MISDGICFVILTRMTGEPSEFKDYFRSADGSVAVALNGDKLKLLPLSSPLSDISPETRVIFVDGCLVNISDSNRGVLEVLLRKLRALNKTVVAAYHSGSGIPDDDVVDLLHEMATSVTEYSLGDYLYQYQNHAIYKLGVALGKSLGNTDPTSMEVIPTCVDNLRSFLIKSRFVVAFAILCQGYLVAHGAMEIADKIPLIPERCLDTERRSWWSSVFGGAGSVEDTEVYREMRLLGHAADDMEKVDDLFNAAKSGTLECSTVRSVLALFRPSMTSDSRL